MKNLTTKKVRTLGFDFWPKKKIGELNPQLKWLRSGVTAALLHCWGRDIKAGWESVFECFWILQINQYDVSAKKNDTHYLQMVDSSIAQHCHSVSHCGFRRFRLSIPTAPILMPRQTSTTFGWSFRRPKNVGITKDITGHYGCRMIIQLDGPWWVQNDNLIIQLADGGRLGSLDSSPFQPSTRPFNPVKKSELLSSKVTSQTRVAVNEGFLTGKAPLSAFVSSWES